MSGSSVQQPAYEESPDSEKIMYGIFRHDNPESDPATSSPRRIATAENWDKAYHMLRTLAKQQLDANVDWGSTREVVSQNIVEYIDSSDRVRLRYQIDTLVETGQAELWKPIYTRRRDLLQPTEEHNAPVCYGIFVGLDVDKPQLKQNAFVCGFKSFREAKYAVILSANGYIRKHRGARMVEEQTVRVLGVGGEVEREYRVEQGRLVQGAFVVEEGWRDRTDYLSAPEPVLRPPIPAQQVALPAAQQAPTPQAAPPQQPDDHVATGEEELWCVCHEPDDGLPMIGCENGDDCPIQWFHIACIGMTRTPPKDVPWWCDACRPQVGKAEEMGKGKGKR